MVELVLTESTEVVRKKPGVLITRHRLGLVVANAGIDQSNVDHDDGEMALLLPVDPDASAPRCAAICTAAAAWMSASSSPTAPTDPGVSAPSASPSALPDSPCWTTSAADTTCSAAN